MPGGQHVVTIILAGNQQSFLRWVGWALLLAAAGPLLQGGTARQIRRSLLMMHVIGIHVLVGVSIMMFFTGVSLGGQGGFSGLTAHAMIMSPLAGLAGLDAYRRAGFSKHRSSWLAYAAAAGLVVVVAGSRGAVIASLGGLAVLAYQRRQVKLLWMVIPLAAVWLGLFLAGPERDGYLPDEEPEVHPWLERLSHKGARNTRAEHWQARWQEFRRSPIFGVGFQHAEGAGGARSLTGGVEPGSSYLAILSMTGVVGAAGFAILGSGLLHTLSQQWKLLNWKTRQLLAPWCTLFLLQMVFEGYLMGVGSWLCLMFWLCVGTLFDSPPSMKGRRDW